jgi:hypothetical protein
MAQIFVSYRRSDSAYVAASITDKLQQHFGEDSVFFDVDDIPLGVDFREYIGNAVGQCDVLLAIIGDQWVRAADDRGNRRIDDPSDFVRIEIESALKRNIPVIPVLVGQVQMPSANDLPPSIQSIVYRNATELRAGRDLRQHIELLIKGLESLFGLKKLPDGKAISEKEPVPDKQAKVSDKAGAPSDLLEKIQKSLAGLTDKSLFVGTIPPKKLNNAIKTYATQVSPADVLLLYDNTVFGSAKDGLLLTAEEVYWRNDSEPERLRYAEIRKVDTLKYTLSTAIVLNEKEILIGEAEDPDKLAKALANVIRGLTGR